MNKNLFSKLEKNGTIHRKKSPDKSYFLKCVTCDNQILDHRTTKNGPVCLCYKCGSLSYSLSNKQIQKMTGNANDWSDDVDRLIEVINTTEAEYKSVDLDGRMEEFKSFVADKIRSEVKENSADEVEDDDLFDIFSSCSICGEKFYDDSLLNHILLEYDSPNRSYEIIQEEYVDHEVRHIESSDFEPFVNPKGIWLTKHKKELPFLKVDKKLRDAVILAISQMYAEWVLDGAAYDINHDNDPDWDCSGELEFIPTSIADRLICFKNLGEWMYHCFNGDTSDGARQGSRFRHDTYDVDVFALISEMFEDKFFADLDDSELNEFFNKDDAVDAMYDLEFKMLEFIAAYPAVQAWILAKDKASVAVEERERRYREFREKYEENKMIVQKVWQDDFGGFKRITDANSELFFVKLKEVIAKSDGKVIAAMQQVPFPCSFTKKTKGIFDKIIGDLSSKQPKAS
jgi:hypothetical protein